MRELPSYQNCFVCGRKNQSGLNLKWVKTTEGVQGKYKADEKHSGYKGILHGGIISALLDECIGWAVAQKEKKMHFTGELNIMFKALIPISTDLTILGYYSEEQVDGKSYRKGHGKIIDEQGFVYATARGLFFPIPKEHEEYILNILELQESAEKKITIKDLWG